MTKPTDTAIHVGPTPSAQGWFAGGERVGHAFDIAHVGDRDLGTVRLEPRATCVFAVHHGADGIAGLQ